MSNVSDIHAAIKAKVIELFPSKTTIPNPFQLEQNNDNFLKNGFGFYYGPASLPNFDLGIHLQGYLREFNIVFSKKIYRLEADSTPFETAQLALIEDQNTLINNLATVRSIDPNVVRLEFVSDGGIEFIFNEKNNYLALSTTFDVSYKEDKTYT